MPNKKTVVITGAGSGLGKEFTKLSLADGHRVVAVSLLESELNELSTELAASGGELSTMQCDLSVSDSAEQVVKYCDDNGLEVDVLFNNAGFVCYGDTVDLDLDRLTAMLELNMVTLTRLAVLFGKQMKTRRRGSILNVGSTGGMMPAVHIATYAASKAYVNSFSYALRQELKPYGVNVTCLTPGAVDTKFAHGDINASTGTSILRKIYNSSASSPAEVARTAYDGMNAGKAQILTGKGSLMAAIVSHILPQKIIPAMVKNT
jgi:short-subunit dehydrogenase